MGIPAPSSVIVPTSYTLQTDASGSPSTIRALAAAPGLYTLSGALTADTYATIIDLTDNQGVIGFAGVGVTDTTSRTVSLKITIDGTVIYDDTSGTITSTDYGIVAIGYWMHNVQSGFSYQNAAIFPIPFAKSLKIEIKSSLTETDKIYLKHAAHWR